jgi:hypothetical protein
VLNIVRTKRKKSPKKYLKKKDLQFYTVSVRTFVIPFYYGSGSAKAKSYGSYGSGSATLDLTYSEKVTDLNKAHHGHEQPHHRHLDLDLGVTSEIFTIRVNKTSLIFFFFHSERYFEYHRFFSCSLTG